MEIIEGYSIDPLAGLVEELKQRVPGLEVQVSHTALVEGTMDGGPAPEYEYYLEYEGRNRAGKWLAPAFSGYFAAALILVLGPEATDQNAELLKEIAAAQLKVL
jgi:hypothetical protein